MALLSVTGGDVEERIAAKDNAFSPPTDKLLYMEQAASKIQWYAKPSITLHGAITIIKDFIRACNLYDVYILYVAMQQDSQQVCTLDKQLFYTS